MHICGMHTHIPHIVIGLYVVRIRKKVQKKTIYLTAALRIKICIHVCNSMQSFHIFAHVSAETLYVQIDAICKFLQNMHYNAATARSHITGIWYRELIKLISVRSV